MDDLKNVTWGNLKISINGKAIPVESIQLPFFNCRCEGMDIQPISYSGTIQINGKTLDQWKRLMSSGARKGQRYRNRKIAHRIIKRPKKSLVRYPVEQRPEIIPIPYIIP